MTLEHIGIRQLSTSDLRVFNAALAREWLSGGGQWLRLVLRGSLSDLRGGVEDGAALLGPLPTGSGGAESGGVPMLHGSEHLVE